MIVSPLVELSSNPTLESCSTSTSVMRPTGDSSDSRYQQVRDPITVGLQRHRMAMTVRVMLGQRQIRLNQDC